LAVRPRGHRPAGHPPHAGARHLRRLQRPHPRAELRRLPDVMTVTRNRNPHHVPTVLVANRGEIACRVFRTVKRMGLRSAAVYSEADFGAPFVRMADAAYCIGPAPATQSYLRIDRILEAAKALRADLVHPGFGFLSEDASFGRAVEAAGLAFVGPPPGVLAVLGGKDEAKRIAEAAGVPVLPGYGGDDQDDAALE